VMFLEVMFLEARSLLEEQKTKKVPVTRLP
jgi:hypothetical protein